MTGGLGRRSFLTGALIGAATVATAAAADAAQSDPVDGRAPAVPFHGVHQAGIVSPLARQSAFLSFDVIAANRAELTDLLRTLTDRVRFLTGGGQPTPVGITGPPVRAVRGRC